MELAEESLVDVSSPPKKAGVIQSTSKRVRMIFSVMASPNRIDILRILNSKGPLTYSELKSFAGFKSKKESGKFAYHLRKLLKQSLVALNKSEKRYTITNLGKLVLSLARQIEERSIIESGKMYVRSSNESIEEFNSHKIIQSLVREGSLPLEQAQKITEEAENRIYKHQTTYLTGPLIRELVNSVLLEHGHEEYRNKLVRLGMPVFDVAEMISNVDGTGNGAEGLLFRAGQKIFNENLLVNTLPKDVADSHLSGDIHIFNPGVWSILPDTIFINAKELLGNGVDLGGKYLDISRINSIKTLDDLMASVSIIFSLITKEASQEVVVDDITSLFSKHTKDIPLLENNLTNAFATASVAPKYNKSATIVSMRLQLGVDTKIVNAVLNAYKNYVRITPQPKIGLVIDYDKGKISDVSTILSEIINLGGIVSFGKNQLLSTKGILHSPKSSTSSSSIKLQSISINLPRLAFESNKDETYFRARLVLLMKPALASMALRQKDISDLTKRGLNPILAKNSQYMQRSTISLVINLVGLHEAIFNILGCKNDKDGHNTLYKVIETAIDVASKKGKELNSEVAISMVQSPSATRFATLDAEKYGKNSILTESNAESYSNGFDIPADQIDELSPKSSEIMQCNKLTKTLTGGIATTVNLPKDASTAQIKNIIEKSVGLVSSFIINKPVPICGECGFKHDEKLADRCPNCKSSFII